jgi:TfoX/Sxy family transcriptional regulator of competence genes
MAWVKVPPEHHPIFHDALPKDRRVETMKLFGGVGAKVNGNFFAGLFARSVMVWLPEGERAEALALEGAAYFDPMGDGRMRSDKVMLPEAMMDEPEELRRWLARSFAAAALLPKKSGKASKAPSKGAARKVVAKAKPKVAGGAKAKRAKPSKRPKPAKRPKR